ncbi:MAG: GNAT family N-acetyltransferase [Anaerolineaceae bacterium]
MENINHNYPLAPLPQQAGFTFRSFGGSGDYQAIVDIIMSNTDDPNNPVTSLEDITSNYSHMTESVPERDVIFAFHAEQPAAYCRTTSMWEESSNSWVYGWLMHIHHDWKRQGIEEALIGWLEDQALLNHQTLRPDTEGMHSVFTPEEDQYLLDILQNRSYSPVRYFVSMKRDLVDIPDQPIPEGIGVKPAYPSQYHQVWDANVEAFQDHWGATIPPESEYQEWISNKNYFQPYLWQIAWDGDEVAGMVLNFINLIENQERGRLRGYTENICVRRAWRGKGIAKALICRSMKMFKTLGMEEVALGADSENVSGATKLYYGLGYRSYNRSVVMRKPLIG